MSESKQSDVIRNVEIVTFHKFPIFVSYLKTLLADEKIIGALSIAHDKGIDADKPHVHCMIRFSKPVRFSSFQKKLDEYVGFHQNTRYEAIHKEQAAIDYLTHKNNPEKQPYSNDSIIEIGKYVEMKSTKKELKVDYIEMLQEIIDGEQVSYMVSKYGRDYIINFEKYYNIAMLLKNELKGK